MRDWAGIRTVWHPDKFWIAQKKYQPRALIPEAGMDTTFNRSRRLLVAQGQSTVITQGCQLLRRYEFVFFYFEFTPHAFSALGASYPELRKLSVAPVYRQSRFRRTRCQEPFPTRGQSGIRPGILLR